MLIEIGGDRNVAEIGLRYGFQPHGLPDPRGGCVKDSAGLLNLLATSLKSRIAGIPNRYDQFVGLSRFQCRRNIERKGIEASLVRADFLAIHPDGGFPVDCAKVEQDVFIGPAGIYSSVFNGDCERSSIPQFVVGAHEPHDTRQGRFHRKRDQDFARFPLGRQPGRFWLNGILPQSIQIQPVFADQLRPGIFGMNLFRRYIRRPLCHQRSGFCLPVCCRCRNRR